MAEEMDVGRHVDFGTAPMHDQQSNVNLMQNAASSPPVEGREGQHATGSPAAHHPEAPLMRRNDQLVTTATATAVTPDSRQFAPPEMMSPPYSMTRRTEMSPRRGTALLSVSPAKRASTGRTGEFHHGVVFLLNVMFRCANSLCSVTLGNCM